MLKLIHLQRALDYEKRFWDPSDNNRQLTPSDKIAKILAEAVPVSPIMQRLELHRAMDRADQQGYIRTWIEEKWAYGWLWRTSEGNLLEEKPGLSPIMQRLELHRAMDRASQQQE